MILLLICMVCPHLHMHFPRLVLAHESCDAPEESVKQLLDTELDLCGKLLEVDERNFHCWNHRMHVMGLIRTWQKDQAEPMDLGSIDLKLSTDLINRNFSNYSAWHLRTLLQQRAGTEE